MAIFGYSQVAAAAKGALKSTPIGGALGGLASSLSAGGLSNALTGGDEKKKRRPRRRTLTLGQKADIQFLKDTVSLKAAEAYVNTHRV